MTNEWKYLGDINLEHGGLYIKADDQFDDFAYAVNIIPESDMGGRNNVWLIEPGSIYIGTDKTRHKEALQCCGIEYGQHSFDDLVWAMFCYSGVESSIGGRRIVQIGKNETGEAEWLYNTPCDKADIYLGDNSDLRGYVENCWLD